MNTYLFNNCKNFVTVPVPHLFFKNNFFQNRIAATAEEAEVENNHDFTVQDFDLGMKT
jgi:hypothetical protein